MSLAPSSAPSGRIVPYDVGFAVLSNPVTSFFEDTGVMHTIGTQADSAGVRLFTRDCVNETELDSLTAALSVAPDPFNGDFFSYNISFAPGNFASDSGGFVTYDSTFGYSVGYVELCTRVSSYVGTTAVSFLETNFRFDFDLTSNGFDIGGIELGIVEEPQEIEDNFGLEVIISACQVNSVRDCEPYTVTQNLPLRVVLYLTSEADDFDITSVSIFNFNMTVYSDEITYVPVQLGEESWDANQITVVQPFVDGRGNCILIETFIVAEFFFADSPELAIEGHGFLSFTDGRTTTDDVEPYALIIDIGTEIGRGCLQNMLLPSIKKLFSDTV